MASTVLGKGTLNFSCNQVFQDECPNKVIVCFLCSEATSTGSLTENPWNFQNYDLSQISLSVDGVPVNGGPICMQVSHDKANGYAVVPVLTNLLKTTKKWLYDEGMGLPRDDITGGFALYAFDTQPDFDGNDYLSLKRQGKVRIDAQFKMDLPHTVNCIVLAKIQGYFEISQSRDVIIN